MSAFHAVCLLVLLTAVQCCDKKYEGNCPIDLASAGDFAILTKAGISTVPQSKIVGNIGVSPIAATAMTGFSLVSDVSYTYSQSTQVTGKCLAADYTVPTSSDLTVTILEMEAAYNDAAGRANTNGVELKAGLIGGETLTPGVYTWTTNINMAADIYLDAQNNANAVFILQTSKNVIVATSVKVILVNGTKASNVFWQVAEAVLVGVSAHLEGTLLVKTAATFQTHSSINGRILAQTAVALQMTTVRQPGYIQIPSTFIPAVDVGKFSKFSTDNSTNSTRMCEKETDISSYGSDQCKNWAETGYCVNERFAAYMEGWCRASCCLVGH
jgi:hypothetical protein